MNDTISRQAAIEAAERESQVDGAYGYMDTKSIVDMLNDLPSAQTAIDKLIELLTIERDKAEAWRKDCVAFGSTQLRTATQAVLDFNRAISLAKGL